MKKIVLFFSFLTAIYANKTLCAAGSPYLQPESAWYQRIMETIGCHDCDYIPKVPGAGQYFSENGIDYQLMHNGLKVLKGCYCGEGISCIIEKLNGHHEPQEEKVFFEVLKYIPHGATMLELGSYWAYYSMWFQKNIPSAVNYMVEPDRRYLEIGKKNFALNNMTGTFIQGFIADKTAAIPASLENIFKQDGLPLDNPIYTVDGLVAAYKIPFIWILHSDIQGFEYQMLLGCKRTFAQKKIGYFFISTHSEEVHVKCKNVLLEQSFIIVAEHTPAESVSCDGLIVARAPYVTGPTKIEVSKKGQTNPHKFEKH